MYVFSTINRHSLLVILAPEVYIKRNGMIYIHFLVAAERWSSYETRGVVLRGETH